MKKLAVLLAAAPLLLCAPLASSADASSAGDPGAFVLSEAEVDQMARNTHDFNQAIAAGNAADVRRLLSTGITPNIVLENGDTPLTWALRSESWDLARVLLDAQGIDVNMENRHGETPLMLAVIKGREAEFDRLLKLGAKVNKTRGWTPLHYAATEGRTSMMKRLIELGADVNAQTKAGITALDMAATTRGAFPTGVVLHADRGTQFTSQKLAAYMRAVKGRVSMGRAGVCWDNAMAESFWATLKTEYYYRRTFTTRDQVYTGVATWIEDFYNRRRIHTSLGGKSPIEYELHQAAWTKAA